RRGWPTEQLGRAPNGADREAVLNARRPERTEPVPPKQRQPPGNGAGEHMRTSVADVLDDEEMARVLHILPQRLCRPLLLVGGQMLEHGDRNGQCELPFTERQSSCIADDELDLRMR